MESQHIMRIVEEMLGFPDTRVDARERHFSYVYPAFVEAYPALFQMCCAAGPRDGPEAQHVRRMLVLMMAHRRAGIRAPGIHDAPSLAVRRALVQHYVTPVLEAAASASNAPAPLPPQPPQPQSPPASPAASVVSTQPGSL